MMRHGSFLLIVIVAGAASQHVDASEKNQVHVLGTLMPEQPLEFDMSTAVRLAGLRLAKARQVKELAEREAKCAGPISPQAQQQLFPDPDTQRADQSSFPEAQHHRKLLATPTPTPVPTTSGITTHAQLSAAVASSEEEIIVVADMAFPSQSPITVNTSQSVSIVGRPSAGGDVEGRVTLDGLGDSRLFLVRKFGSLHLTNLNLINGQVPETTVGQCIFDVLEMCAGAHILVLEGSALVLSHCDIRGQGTGTEGDRRVDATSGGGVYSVPGHGMTHSFLRVRFTNLRADDGAAFHFATQYRTGKARVATFKDCEFTGNYAYYFAVGFISPTEHTAFFYDCVWENNEGLALGMTMTEPTYLAGFYRCIFRNNTHLSPTAYADERFGAGVIVIADSIHAEIVDCIFERNVGMLAGTGGAVGAFSGSVVTLTNCTFVENNGALYGGAVTVLTNGEMTIIACLFLRNSATIVGGSMYINEGTVTVVNSTFVGESSRYGGSIFSAAAGKDVVVFENSVWRDNYAEVGAVMWFSGASVLMTDCIVRDNFFTVSTATIGVEAGGTFRMVRTRMQNNGGTVASGIIGCFYGKASTVTVEDSDLIDCHAAAASGVFFGRSGGVFTFQNSRIIGTKAPEQTGIYKHSLGYLDVVSSVRFVGGTILNVTGAEDKYAIWDDSPADFSVQMDSVVVDETVSIFSNGTKVLLQNCDGFTSTAVAKAEVATCASTAAFCLRESCIDTSVGNGCVCKVDGAEVPFPTDCMQVGGACVPSHHPTKSLNVSPSATRPPAVCGDRGPCAVDARADLYPFEAEQRNGRAYDRECVSQMT